MDAVLASAGAGHRIGTDQVAVNISWLRTSARDVAADWADRFEKMLAFAGTKGWLTDDGAAVLGPHQPRLKVRYRSFGVAGCQDTGARSSRRGSRMASTRPTANRTAIHPNSGTRAST